MFFFNPDITTLKIYSDQEDDRYYVGEDVILRADFGNPSSVKSFVWHKQTERDNHYIDNALPRYKGSGIYPEMPLLKITKCNESDAGTYILLVSCKDVDIYSNIIHLKVQQGMTFSQKKISKQNIKVVIKYTNIWLWGL